jgi:CO/xanthine dehydrogenase Mo-binding subunit
VPEPIPASANDDRWRFIEPYLSRWVEVFDIGRVINTRTASSQLRGGIVMGLGMAMAEENPRTGRIMNPSLAEYHLPVHADVPLLRSLGGTAAA